MSLAWLTRRARRPGRPLLIGSGFALLLALEPAPSAAAEAPAWRIERGDLRVVVPLLPGGAFEARTSSLSGALALGPEKAKPASLTGELSVELATIDTGISLRNEHLREKYLQVARGPGFDKAVLSEIRVDDAADAGFDGRSAFTGTLSLHDARRQVTGTAVIRQLGSAVRVEASFPLALTDFGIEPPSYLGVGVANKVLVKVLFTATLQPPAGR